MSYHKEHEDDPDALVFSEGPPRGLPQWNFYCPGCKRHGVTAWQSLFTGQPADPATFFCPDCFVPVEILGRHDQ